MIERIDLTDQSTIQSLVLEGRTPLIFAIQDDTVRVTVPNTKPPGNAVITTRDSIADRVFYVMPDGTSHSTGSIQELTVYDANTMRLMVDNALVTTGQREPTLPWLLQQVVNALG